MKILGYLKFGKHSYTLKNLFFVISLISLIGMLAMSQSAGISGDEHVNYEHSEFVYNYYQTLGQDTTALNTPKTKLKHYGQSFDNITYVVNRWFDIENYYESRHLLNALSGWLLILFSGLTAILLFGWRAGIITSFLMFFFPIILGHSWSNPKDIPFAFTYTFFLFFLIKLLKGLPRIKVSTIIFLTVGIAATISIRIGGLIAVPYLFLFFGFYYIVKKDFYTKAGFVTALKQSLLMVVICIAGYLLGLIFWPYALEAPLKNPFEALKEMTNFNAGPNQLFEGIIAHPKNLPWYYAVKNLLIKSPIIVFLGLIIFLITVPFRKELKKSYILYSLLLFAFAFPIAYIIYKDSNLYGASRHLLWIISPAVILSAGGFDYLLNKKNRYIRYGTIAIMAILLFHPLRHTFKNHPHQYIYYNQLVGGVNGAHGEYETDYYYHGLKAASDWFIENKLNSDSITIVTNHSNILKYYFRKYPNVKITYSKFYRKSSIKWDYAIWTNTHVSPLQLQNGDWPPKETLHTIDVDDAPIAAIVKRMSYIDFKGIEALKRKNIPEAKRCFEAFLKIYPGNEEILAEMARAYLMERKYDKAIAYADSSLSYNPRQVVAMWIKAKALNTAKNYKKGLVVCNEILAINQSFADAHYLKGVALKNLNKPKEAIKEFEVTTSIKKNHYASYMQVGEILVNQGKYKDALKMVYNKVLEFKPNDLRATVNIAKCYYFLKDNRKAEQFLKEAQKEDRNNFDVVKLRCRMEMDRGNINSAIKGINMCRRILDNSELYVIHALLYIKINKQEHAKQYLKKAIKLDRTNNEAKKLLVALLQKEKKTKESS
jgi:tetratricopeptide (TPR) repeat protein